jgi:opine dehydrogenase
VLAGADLILLVGPAYSTEPFGEACRPYIKPGQTFVVCPSSCGGGILFKKTAGLDMLGDTVQVGETSTLPYAARLDAPGKVHVFLKLRGGLYLAGIPGSCTQDIYAKFSQNYPDAEPASAWVTMLQNNNPIIHPAVTILNAGAIERLKGDLLFYEECVMPSVGRLIKAVDDEKILIGEKLGVHILPDHELGVLQGYMIEASYEDGYRSAPGFKGIKAQKTLDHRYLNEDVGYGLIFYRDLAHHLGIVTPVMDSVIQIASVIMKRDYAGEKARTLATLGLNGYTPNELADLFSA